MSDNGIREQLKDAMGAAHGNESPAFAKMWTAAGLQHHKSRRRYATFSGIAALITVVAGFRSIQEAEIPDEYLIADSLLNGTQWSAPSDTLMPQHEFDVYRELPSQMESTNLDEGSLL